jgi:glycosyltransferase involved in cell wall biosynthesis
MKVLHVAQPVEGGTAVVAANLLSDQLDRGWQPVIACPPEGMLWQAAGQLGAQRRTWQSTRSPGPATLGEIKRLRAIIAEIGPDVIHLHSSKAGLAGRLAVRGSIPTVFQPHLWSFQADEGITSRPSKLWERRAARWTDVFVCVSDEELSDGRAAGIAGEAVIVRNGVDTNTIRPAGDRVALRERLGLPPGLLVVCVARLTPLKGHDLLLTAWPEVTGSVPDAVLALVGDGPLLDELKQSHPVADGDSVRWLGHRPDATDYLAAADVVVVPSRAEGMALVPLEALATGTPVVAFETGGIGQSVGDAGVVLRVGDVDGLARELVLRLKDPTRRADEGARARSRAVQYFDRARAGDAVAAITTQLLRRP